jgi:hypothetical protein
MSEMGQSGKTRLEHLLSASHPIADVKADILGRQLCARSCHRTLSAHSRNLLALVATMSASEYAAFVRAETEKFGAIVKQANIKAEN